MEVEKLVIPEVKLVTPKVFRDERGFFSETYNSRALAEAGIEAAFVQDNHSFSVARGTIRGLHFQIPPYAQDKLVRVTRGAIFDVAVDIHTGSPTYGQHVTAVLSAENWRQIWVPKGFAHGFCTLEPDTEVIYKVSDYYAPDCDKGLAWNDPEFNIDWPVEETAAIVSEKDRVHPRLAELPAYFPYGSEGSPAVR